MTSLQLKPRRPRFEMPNHLRGQRMPRSHIPVPHTSKAVTIPLIKHTFSVMSTTQYTEPPTPTPSSRGAKNRAYPKLTSQTDNKLRKKVCLRRRVRSSRYCARKDASRISMLRYIIDGELGVWVNG